MSGIDRTVTPPAGPLRDFSFPAVTRLRLDTGLPVDVVRVPHLPVATALLVLPAGEDTLPEEHAGLAVLAGDALEGGTHHRSGVEMAEALETIGADLDASTGWNATTVSLSCLADHLDRGLTLLGEMVLDAAFPEEEVTRVRGQQLARIQQRAMDPGALASDRAAAEIYAPGEPYGRPILGSLESISGVTPAALRGFAESYYRPAGGGLVVAGDVDPAEVEAMALRVFGAWTGAPPSRSIPNGAHRSAARRVTVVDRPGSVQSELRLGHPGAPRTVAGYEALVVTTAILGGTFSSRLNLNLREKHGFTYGVRCRIGYRRGPGPLSVATAVDTAVTARAVAETIREMDRYVREGPTEDEVASARDYLAGIFPLRLETTGQVAARVAELRVYGLPEDTWAGYRDRIRGVTRQAAAEAARTHIRPEELAITVVGDADSVVPELEGLDLGPVEVQNP